MKILLLRLPNAYGASPISKILSPGGYLTSKLYCEWLVRYPPLGLLYCGSILKKHGHTVRLIDGELSGTSFKKIALIANEFKPDIICASVNLYNPRVEFDFLASIKKTLNSTFIVARGHFPQLYPEESINNDGIDYVLTGKGFNAIIDLTKAIEQGTPLQNVNGIIFRNTDKTIIQTPDEQPYDFNALPHPARDLIDNSDYTTALTKYDLFTIITTSIGCPFSCTYCVDRHIRYQARSIDNVISEIKECINKYKIKEITFLDSTFSIDRSRTVLLCQEIIKQNIKFKWAIRTRVDCVDKELLSLMAKAGCISVHYGIESGDQQILNTLNRKETLAQIRQAVELTYRSGMEVLGFFMIGNTGETEQSVQNTIEFALSLPLHIAQFNIAFPVPPSNIYKDSLKKLNCDIWLESYKGRTITTNMCKPQDTTLSARELTELTNQAYRRFYLRPSYLWRTLTNKYCLHIISRQFKLLFLHIKLSFNHQTH